MGGSADGRHVEDVAVGITGRFEIDVNLAAIGETLRMGGPGTFEGGEKGFDIEAIEELDGDSEVGRLAEPIVQELKCAAVDVAGTEDDVAIADQVAENGVNRGHARIEIPGHVFTGQRAALEIHDVVGER